MKRHSAGQSELVPALQVLARCKLFQGLEREGLLAFAGAARTHVFRAGTELYAEGDVSNGLWVVAKGRVRLHHADSAGQFHVVRFHAAGSILNLAAAMDGRPLQTGATALDDVVALYIPRDELLDIGRHHWAAIRNAMDLLCLEIRQRDIASTVGALKDARGRLVCSLLQMAREFGVSTDASVRINYQLSRQDIAEQARVRVETAVRALSDLRASSMIQTEDQIVELLDVAALKGVAECATCELDCSVFNHQPIPG